MTYIFVLNWDYGKSQLIQIEKQISVNLTD